MEAIETEVIDDTQEALPVKHKTGVIESDATSFTYYPKQTTTYDGATVGYLCFKMPNLRKLRNNKVSVSEKMEADQMESMISACCVMIAKTGDDDEEFPSSQKRHVLRELMSVDVLALTAECASRFFGVEID